MFDTICSLPLTSDLLTQAVHPKVPLVAVGLAAGHVQTFRLPSLNTDTDGASESDDRSEANTGFGTVVTEWRTKRHGNSCRCVTWSLDGDTLYSAGIDGLVKAASTETGKVFAKWTLPASISSKPVGAQLDPTTMRAMSPRTLLLGTDQGEILVYDLRESIPTKARPSKTMVPHEDCINSITPLNPNDASSSGFSRQWVSTGADTLVVTDLRKGVISTSEGQEDWLISSAYVKGAGKSDMVVVGGSAGVLTLWPRGKWMDQSERINIDKTDGGESLDELVVLPENDLGIPEVVVGMGDGRMKLVDMKAKKLRWELRHDDEEGVTALGVDVQGRLISGGGRVVKVWRRAEQAFEELAHFRTKRQLEEDEEEDDLANGGLQMDSKDTDDDGEEEREAATRGRKKKRKKGGKSGSKANGEYYGLD